MSNLNFYAKVLDVNFAVYPNMGEVLRWLESRCDSRLEIMFALNFIAKYFWSYFDDPIIITSDYIFLPEPFSYSPTQAGVSSAFLRAQEKHNGFTWDFAVHTLDDNGGEIEDASGVVLIDVDGFMVHRNKRQQDAAKLASATHRAMRLPEERFLSVGDMAEAALFSSVWSCDHESEAETARCLVCSDLKMRPIFSFHRTLDDRLADKF